MMRAAPAQLATMGVLLATAIACSDAHVDPEPSMEASRGQALPQEAATCTATGVRSGDVRGTLSHAGRQRSYLLHVPPGFSAGRRTALVIDLHGYSRTSASQKSGSGWAKVADRENFLVVYPDGVGSSWNVGGCCGTAGNGNVDDVGFVKALVKKLTTEACVDPERVYASGVSNGAGMAGRLSCDAADVIAGVSLVSSDLRTDPCKPARPVTEIAFRGTADTLEPYEGGIVGPPGGQYKSPGARGSFELYRKLNQCTGTPVTSVKYCETYKTCAAGTEVTLCTLPGVGHAPYVNNIGVDIAQTSWDAFERASRTAVLSPDAGG